MKLKRLLVLCLALAVLGLAGSAGAAHDPVKRTPTLLWKSYPLKQRVAATPHPYRPPALAARTSNGGSGTSRELVVLALLGGAMLALTALLAKSRLPGAATAIAARRGGSATSESKPQPSREVTPDLLVALRPTSATAAEIEPEREGRKERQAKSQPPVVTPLVEVEEPAEVEALKAPPVVEDPQLPPPLQFEAETRHLERKAPREEDTEMALETCEIRLWRGYFSHQLYAAPGGPPLERALAFSPSFRLRDEDAPSAKATAALRDLLDQLEAEGWTLAWEGRSWYSFTLERPA